MKELAFAGVLTALSLPAYGAVLDFAGNICDGGSACVNGSFIDQSHGSITGVNVIYNGNVTAFDATNERFQYFSSTFGGGMTDVIITNANFSEISFVATSGFEVSLGGLDLGTFGSNPAPGGITVSVIDLFDDSVLFSSGNLSVAGGGPQNVAFGHQSTTGLKLRFGGNLNNIAIDNISYDATRITTPPAVPLPASGWLLGAALAGFVGLRRKKKA